MTTPTAVRAPGGRTQQGRTPAPGQQMPGSFRPPKRSTMTRPGPGTSGARNSARPGSTSQPASPKQPRRSSPRRVAVIGNQAVKSVAAPQATDYQKVIAAEFVLAELLIALTPMTSKKNPTDVSPYVPRDMTKMLAVGAVYFLLELLAIPAGWGRLMAWFGGLILLAVGLNEGANVARDIDAFAGIKTAASKVSSKVGKGLHG